MNKKENLILDETLTKIYKTSFKMARANTINLEIEETFNKLMEKYIDLEDLIGLS